MHKRNIVSSRLIADILVFGLSYFVMLFAFGSGKSLLLNAGVAFLCLFVARGLGKLYVAQASSGETVEYLRLILLDTAAFVASLLLSFLLPTSYRSIVCLILFVCANLLGGLILRIVFRFVSENSSENTSAEPQVASTAANLTELHMEDLLFRKPVSFNDPLTANYYRDRVVMITGGGGSIGSELCRQLAQMHPGRIILLDIYENGAYDVRQELQIAYGDSLDVCIEIVSIANLPAMERIFCRHRPEIVIHAAAHKHVPLMEHNCIEAVENNVFGTEILVSLCEKYSVGHFMMVSTDKAVNPTNVMGATKRLCEMIVQGAGNMGNVTYSATRFGNVLGSAGSAIPLFKKQIANGGPVTITDKRIVRYFMTISEAAQLVLKSGAMAKNGELFVLDMGQPIKLVDLAENMIRLSGAKDIEILETGLRPGEKLYEELFVNPDELEHTEHKMIFIVREKPVSQEEVEQKLALLRAACKTGNDELVRESLKFVVPTYRTPEELNASV